MLLRKAWAGASRPVSFPTKPQPLAHQEWPLGALPGRLCARSRGGSCAVRLSPRSCSRPPPLVTVLGKPLCCLLLGNLPRAPATSPGRGSLPAPGGSSALTHSLRRDQGFPSLLGGKQRQKGIHTPRVFRLVSDPAGPDPGKRGLQGPCPPAPRRVRATVPPGLAPQHLTHVPNRHFPHLVKSAFTALGAFPLMRRLRTRILNRVSAAPDLLQLHPCSSEPRGFVPGKAGKRSVSSSWGWVSSTGECVCPLLSGRGTLGALAGRPRRGKTGNLTPPQDRKRPAIGDLGGPLSFSLRFIEIC